MNPNADYLGIVTMLRSLREQGLISGSEAKKIAARLMVSSTVTSQASVWRISQKKLLLWAVQHGMIPRTGS